MLKLIIIEDEVHVRNSLEKIIQNYCTDIEIIEKCDSVSSGLLAIYKNNPDIVFLDINLPDGSGFDILSKLSTISFKLIFITAYQEFAIKAIKFCALDYILKPFDISEIVEAVNKAKVKINEELNLVQVQTLLSNFSTQKTDIKKIILKTNESIHVIDIQNIIRCEADNNYTNFYLKDNKKLLVSNTLKDYEVMLSDFKFIRVHQSHLINLNFVVRLDKREGFTLVMSDNSHIPVSARKRNLLLEIFDNL